MEKDRDVISPKDIANYFLMRTAEDGELITPLKMQKLIYYAYVWYLIKKGRKLFHESIEAWANGPVVPSLYHELKHYGSTPINAEEYTGMKTQTQADVFTQQFTPELIACLCEVYDKYQTKTAFELVVATHGEKPWIEARKGLAPHDISSSPILDEHIIAEFSAHSDV